MKYKVLFSRNRLGKQGDVINLSQEKAEVYLDLGLVEEFKESKSKKGKKDIYEPEQRSDSKQE